MEGLGLDIGVEVQAAIKNRSLLTARLLRGSCEKRRYGGRLTRVAVLRMRSEWLEVGSEKDEGQTAVLQIVAV